MRIRIGEGGMDLVAQANSKAKQSAFKEAEESAANVIADYKRGLLDPESAATELARIWSDAVGRVARAKQLTRGEVLDRARAMRGVAW